jgi:adenosylcobinamide hydrolase
MRTHYRVTGDTLVIDLRRPGRVLSSAPRGGGLRSTRYILNHQVTVPIGSEHPEIAVENPRDNPSRYLRQVANALGVDSNCVSLMTAVPMNQLVIGHEEYEGIWVECFATVGITNAVRAGEWPAVEFDPGRLTPVGTINLILVTNAALSSAAMVGAVQVATESKTGILRDHAVSSWTGMPGATGTGTDVVVVASRFREKDVHLSYSGTHTVIGAMIGRVVADCVTQGLARAERWSVQVANKSRPVST